MKDLTGIGQCGTFLTYSVVHFLLYECSDVIDIGLGQCGTFLQCSDVIDLTGLGQCGTFLTFLIVLVQ